MGHWSSISHKKKNQKKETIGKRWCGQKITPHPLRVTILGDRGVKSIFHLFLSLNYFSLFTFNLFFLFSGNDTKRKVRTTEDHFHFFVSLFRDFPRFFFFREMESFTRTKGEKRKKQPPIRRRHSGPFLDCWLWSWSRVKKKEAKKSFSAKTKSNRIPTALCKSNWYKP